MSRPVSVAIVEDDPLLLASWVKIVTRMPGYRCRGQYGSAEAALEDLPGNPPDFVLMDINLPGMSGIECTRNLKRILPQVDVIMLTMFADGDNLFDSLRAGACGYLLKRTTAAALKDALDLARIGGSPMSPQIARQVVHFFQQKESKPKADELEKLSDREAEILRLLSEGHPYKEIADHLGISMDTVRTHIRRIYHKLHVHSRTEAVVKYLDAKHGSPGHR